MKKSPFLLAALLAFPAISHANDTSVAGIGGRWQIVQKEHPSVRMVKEKIDLTIAPDKAYTTVADFVFQNNGPATNVQMGFPESGYGDIDTRVFKNKSSFRRFRTWVDGVPISAKRRITSSGEGSFVALWVKTVPFESGQIRRVRVRYQSEVGTMSAFPNYFASYDFTGGNWRGNVASSVLTVHLNVPGTYIVSTDKFAKASPQFQRKGNRFTYTWNNWQAQQAFAFRFGSTFRNWLGDGSVPGLPVTINGKPNESIVSYMPRGVIRNGQTFVNLRSWLDWGQEEKILTSSYDAKTRRIVVRQGAQVVNLPVQPTRPGFTVEQWGGNQVVFLPISQLEREFGAKFEVSPKTHLLKFLK